jgi:hydroxyethylthiazole kinase
MAVLPEIARTLTAIREKTPLIHHITNYVTANDSANVTLAIGASPVMTGDPGEAADMVARAAALVLKSAPSAPPPSIPWSPSAKRRGSSASR